MYIIIGLLLITILILTSISNKINKLENNLRHINFKLDKIIKQEEIDEFKIDNDKILSLIEEGKRFDASSKLMETMGFSVKESQEYIDTLINKN
ncbi:hypothetical protein [Clostridium cochlearium]|uniref:hypothetical protein n=1 Tax=Clostridium cochlearium TaxID=1494 RepID=UPI001C0F2CE1|nr:hypothetical protein [Clostridium cochlearium]MBU5269416.1 50S ribosomal protein L7/L12 [Clostridium cochlearium]